MGSCKICKRFGIFLNVNKKGICNACLQVAKIELPQRAKIIEDSARLVTSAKKLETRLSRYNDLMTHAGYIFDKYEKNGVYPVTPKAESYLKQFGDKESKVVADWFSEKEVEADDKIKQAKTQKEKIKVLSKFVAEVQKYLSLYPSERLTEIFQRSQKLLTNLHLK